MRAAGAITGLLVLGTCMIPSGYGPKPDAFVHIGDARRQATNQPGRGSASLSGLVLGPDGAPLRDVTVSLAGSGFWPARSVRSGPDGRFEWTGIPPGIYELRAAKDQLVAPPVQGLILDAGSRRAFGMQLARGWTLAGRTIDAESGRPVAEAEVTVTTGALGVHSRQARSDAGGRFEIIGIVGDEHGVYVEADGYVAAGPLRHGPDTPSITVRLERASAIEGHIRDERGRPVEGATVRAFGEGELRAGALRTPDSLGVTAGPIPPISAVGTGALAFVQQVVTESDGGFRIGSLRPGTYTIAASHDEFVPVESEQLAVSPGALRSDVELVLRSGAELVGRVIDERGSGLEGIPVELRAPGERLPRMTVTESDGSFSFRGVRGGISVSALPYDLPPTRQSIEVGGDGRASVELVLSSTLYSLRGRVVDERGLGVSGAVLTVAPSDGVPVRRTAKSDVDGTFSVPALPAPPFDLEAEHPAFSPTRLSEVDATEDVSVVMYTGVTFLGTVYDRWSSERLRGVSVRMEGPATLDSSTRSDGTFVFRRVPTGNYDIVFFHPDYESQLHRVVLEPPGFVDRPQELDTVWLEPGGSIEGEVLDANNDSVPDAEVTWGDPPLWERATRSNARGEFTLRGVPAGWVWVTARHPAAGEASSDESVVVRPLESSPGALVRLPGERTE
jgi:protocatechuate 3,4-dioxygenase beta subunit